MPPKKGKKKKSGKKSKKSSQASAKTTESHSATKSVLSYENKANFLVQTKDLEKQIERLQRESDELEIENVMFASEFQQTNEDKDDICEYLEKTLDIRLREFEELRLEYESLEKFRSQENAAYEEQIKLKTTEAATMQDELQSEKRMKGGQLASMEEFKVQKEELNEKFVQIETEIQALSENNSEDVYQRERAAVVEMEMLKKEMVSRVGDVATEFRKVSNRQMAETNKKTIRENVELAARIQQKSEETLRLLRDNERLRAVLEKEQKLDIEISETVERDLQRKCDANIKIIRSRVEECRGAEEQLTELESEEYRTNAEKIQDDHSLLKTEQQTQRLQLRTVQEESDNFRSKTLETQQHLQVSKTELRMYKRLINRTKNALIDAENLMDPSEEFTEGEILLRRQRMMDNLLLLLNSANKLGLGISPIDLVRSVSVAD